MTCKPFTAASLAQHWGVSDTFVYDQIKAGRLEAMRLGGKLIRIKPEAVEAYEQRATLRMAIEPEALPAAVEHRSEPKTIGRLIRAVG